MEKAMFDTKRTAKMSKDRLLHGLTLIQDHFL